MPGTRSESEDSSTSPHSAPTPGNTHAQARLPQTVIDPLVEALGRSTLGRSKLSMAMSQAVGEAEKEKLGVVADKEKMEKELKLEVSGMREALKKNETTILRLHGKLSVRGALGGWVSMGFGCSDAADRCHR